MEHLKLAANVFACVLSLAAFANAAPATGSAAEDFGNLGDLLLDDDLARALAPAPPAKKTPGNESKTGPADWLPNPDALNRMLEKGAREAAGEDVGGSPLASVVSGMRRAEGQLRNNDTSSGAAPVQREVVAQLEKLIAEMEKQCQSCNKSSKDQKKQASKRSQPKPGECKPGDKEGQCEKPGQPSKKQGTKPNQSGTTSLAGAPNAANPEEQQRLIKAAWGHLPERMREQMLQGSDSEFLPEYRDELQDYYRRLAERSSREAP